jgi:hypothetical protein
MRQKVFQEYGIMNARANDYEIDYLIAPGLGGAEDLHNLWPQPYTSHTWNASVKDALEERLHQLVCSGNLDLRAAQHDIATDWIAAYKKYFHSETPLSQSSNSPNERIGLIQTNTLAMYISLHEALDPVSPTARSSRRNCTVLYRYVSPRA